MSQLELALEAGVSARHVSFVETGRSRPSPDMVLLLADRLEIPLRERNQLLLAAGYAPVFGQRGLDEPEMAPVLRTLDAVLRGHEPYPAVVLDRHWGMVAANRPVTLLTEGVAPALLEPPVNVLRLTLHPEGMAPRISIWPSGEPICWIASGDRSSQPATRRWLRCMRSSSAFPARLRRPSSTSPRVRSPWN